MQGKQSFQVGDELVGPVRAITAQRIEWYDSAMLSAATNELRQVGSNIHTDEEFARSEGFPTANADGMIMTNWCSEMLVRAFGMIPGFTRAGPSRYSTTRCSPNSLRGETIALKLLTVTFLSVATGMKPRIALATGSIWSGRITFDPPLSGVRAQGAGEQLLGSYTVALKSGPEKSPLRMASVGTVVW